MLDESGNINHLTEKMLGGDKRALARLITLVENGGPLGEKVLSAVFARRGRPRIVGVTGPPGSGKSSLVDLLVKELRGEGQTVGVVAVDPNSPFSGGAILGDRIRMQKHFLDSGVFIRSMSSRGSLGGLASATKEVVGLMEAFAFDVIIVETVGVGQSELDIMHVADSTVLLVPPESGDGIQVIKAGVMEIADIFAVNKSDLPGAASAIEQIEAMLHLRPAAPYQPPVLGISCLRGTGVAELRRALDAHFAYLQDSGERENKRRLRRRTELAEILRRRIAGKVEVLLQNRELAGELLELEAGRVDPYQLAERIMGRAEMLKN